MRHVTGLAATFAAMCIVIAPTAAANPIVPQGKIDTLLLSDDDVSSIVGLPLHQVGKVYPVPGTASPIPERDDCRPFVEFDVDTWTGDFTAFRQVSQQDNPDDLQFAGQQFIALYPNVKVAADTFRHAFASSDLSSRCHGVTLTDSSAAQWRVDGISISEDHAGWTNALIRDGQDTTWRCTNEVRLKGNVMFQDGECQFGNGRALVAQMANMTASRIPS